ncbi:hypothetical protein LFADAHJC_LOCUS3492 [Methylorubrum extorquens]
MRVRYVCPYYPNLAHERISPRTEPFWDAYFYVWAVKVGSFKRSFRILRQDDRHVQITPANFSIVRESFGRFVVARIEEEGWIDNPLLVPVPSKDTLPDALESRSSKMVREALAPTGHLDAVFDGLRWKQKLPKASERGERRKDAIKPFLQASNHVRGRNVVLIDDLLTKGGTMLASKERLEEAGATVLGAVACGQTVYEQTMRCFGRYSIELTSELDDISKYI